MVKDNEGFPNIIPKTMKNNIVDDIGRELATNRNTLLSLLKEKSYRKLDKPIRLSSGQTSDEYIDCKQTILSGLGHNLAATCLIDAMDDKGMKYVGVAGVELGGCPLASAVSTKLLDVALLDIPALYVRKKPKEHGTGVLVEGLANINIFGKDEPAVVLFEDVSTTGTSAAEAVKTLRYVGLECDEVITIVDRSDGVAEKTLAGIGVRLTSLFKLSDFR